MPHIYKNKIKKAKDKKALYATMRMEKIKPSYELLKRRITLPLVPIIQATNQKTFD